MRQPWLFSVTTRDLAALAGAIIFGANDSCTPKGHHSHCMDCVGSYGNWSGFSSFDFWVGEWFAYLILRFDYYPFSGFQCSVRAGTSGHDVQWAGWCRILKYKPLVPMRKQIRCSV
ncbi:hypothetical protein BU16DRAFT_367993 [Lophium mytilinum]|uniref:Uncharacterized protein n=1 Tax=Lophium mytilinum TaxID=390894 RepID=A0A6A6QUR1_9PEZI|nr:hypothetical protein BU16DRAFT_367993 [Lophium mytilinum]